MIIPIVLIAVAALGLIAMAFLFYEPAVQSANSGTVDSATLGTRKLTSREDTEQEKEKLRERLIHAGLYKPNSMTYFYLTQGSFAVVPLLLCLLGIRLGLIPMMAGLLGGVIFGILGVVGPGLWLDLRKSKRQTSIRRSIPDALDVITICVEAGLSLNAAIVRVSKDMAATYPLLTIELIIVHRQIQMGKTAGDALRSFAERFDLSELRSLASVVSQSERFGAGIANALRTHSETLRAKRMQKAHERAQKAATWILLPTVFCIFPALFVVILGPAAYDIMDLMENMKK